MKLELPSWASINPLGSTPGPDKGADASNVPRTGKTIKKSGSGLLAGLPPRQTAFLTSEETRRAPSAYYFDSKGYSQRVRQEHDGGPKLSNLVKRAQGFVETREKMFAVASLVGKESAEKKITADDALRLAIMDGVASPVAVAGRWHVEASKGPAGRGNPHISGGTVTDRRNRAGDDRLNEATQSSPETQFRMFSRMRFFA